jgi:S-(hydroxymethyl)glutathione dehydrogenase/alcohol dehydrogenase
MKTNAAILWEFGGNWEVEEIDLDPPQDGEVLVSWEATGLCHSDEHIRTGDLPAPLPMIGGHEGAGIGRSAPGAGAQTRRSRRGVVPARPRPLPVLFDRAPEPV